MNLYEIQRISTHSQVKIGDFGLAKVMSSRCSQKIDLQKEGNINKDSDDKSCPSPRLCGYLNLNNRYWREFVLSVHRFLVVGWVELLQNVADAKQPPLKERPGTKDVWGRWHMALHGARSGALRAVWREDRYLCFQFDPLLHFLWNAVPLSGSWRGGPVCSLTRLSRLTMLDILVQFVCFQQGTSSVSRVRSDQGHSTPMGEIPEPSCKLTPEARRCGFGMLRGDAGSNHQYTHQEEHVCAGTKISGCLYAKTTSSVMRRILLFTTWLALQPYMTGM